ncbi:MAG: hypothetical protein WC996_06815 [Peptostreptococcales bacterium]
MNDCVWIYIVGCEEGCKCCGYRSMNSDEGAELLKAYEKDIEEVISPIKSKWEKIFDEGDW